MGVDTFWRRIAEGAISGLGPRQLSGLVPVELGAELAGRAADPRLVLVQDCGALLGELLRLGAAGSRHAGTARWLAAGPPDWDHRHLVGVWRPEFVRQAAEFLVTVPVEEWLDRFRDELPGRAPEPGPALPTPELMNRMATGVRELRELFGAAARAGEAVLERMVTADATRLAGLP
ncbi:hypothetical protein ACFFWC_27445 [Plantactinospora siamensis]|uniref:Uncharacterized protein n=1 Tax=Plantactinospora siamensis TaxID=555372 RepID=A0ABV6NXQ2_9ACTN